MISSLGGQITRKSRDWVEIIVGGVGYRILIAEKLYKELKLGEEKFIPIHTVVSQDDIRLFGFGSWEELDLFELLITVSGVGPKTALQIVGNYEPIEIRTAIGAAEVKFFEKIKGIGKKTAQRIIVDLKTKIGGSGEIDLSEDNNLSGSEIEESLKQLGFERKEITSVIKMMPADLVGLEQQLQWALRNIK